MPALPLNNEQLAEAAALKRIFLEWQRNRKEQNLPRSQEDVAHLFGFGQSALSQYINGGIPLNVDAAIKFAEVLGCHVADFSPTMVVQMARYSGANSEADTPEEGQLATSVGGRRVVVTEPDDFREVAIRKVELKVHAGFPSFEADPIFEDGGIVNLSRQWIEENELIPHCLLAITVKGESMFPLLLEGDVLIINIADTKREDGELYAINADGRTVVKLLVHEHRQWWMVSVNSEQHPKKPCRENDFIIGKVVRQEPRSFKGRIWNR